MRAGAKLRWALFAVLLIGTVGSLIMSSDSGEVAYERTHRRLLQLEDLDAQVDAAVLALRFELVTNYDELLALEWSLEEWLAPSGHEDRKDRPWRRHVDVDEAEIEAAIAEKLRLLVDFKSEHAIHRNSVAAFTRTARTLADAPDVVSAPAVRESLQQLEIAGLRYVLVGRPDLKVDYRAALERVETAAAGASVSNTREWRQLKAHARQLTSLKSSADEFTRDLLAVPVKDAVDRAVAEAGRLRAINMGEVAEFRRLLALVTLALLLATVVQGIEIRRYNRQVREANETLERRVEERTRELVEAEGLSRLILGCAGEGIIGLDPTGVVTFANPAAARHLKTDPEELVGRDVSAVVHAAAPAGEKCTDGDCPVHGTLDDGEPRHLSDVTLDRADGSTLSVESVSAPMRFEGRHVGAVVTFSDITDRKAAEHELRRVNEELMKAHRAAGKAEVATNVLHEVGNALNSVNVSASLLVEHVRKSRIDSVAKLSGLLNEHAENLGTFMTEHAKGKLVPAYLDRTARSLRAEREAMADELEHLGRSVKQINDIVRWQQANARLPGAVVDVSPGAVVDDALRAVEGAPDDPDIRVVREVEFDECIRTDRHRLLQVLVNLLSNAREALARSITEPRLLVARVVAAGESNLAFEIQDNGPGIAPQDLDAIFVHGFTTKKEGNGFGLHGSALAAVELKGRLSVSSDGPGRGATFRLELPRSLAVAANGSLSVREAVHAGT